MQVDVKRRARREQLALGQVELNGARTHHGATIMSPVITRRPDIDSMLGDMAFCSKILLEKMRNKLMDGAMPDRMELRDFKDTCETVLKQARTEIELEKHAAQRATAMSSEQIQHTIQTALARADVNQEVAEVVLDALGLSPKT